MKETIINVLREANTGLRIREIAARAHINHWKVIGLMDELLKAGQVRCVAASDPAQMEYYNLWEIC